VFEKLATSKGMLVNRFENFTRLESLACLSIKIDSMKVKSRKKLVSTNKTLKIKVHAAQQLHGKAFPSVAITLCLHAELEC
jgi:hypothetical protein